MLTTTSGFDQNHEEPWILLQDEACYNPGHKSVREGPLAGRIRLDYPSPDQCTWKRGHASCPPRMVTWELEAPKR